MALSRKHYINMADGFAKSKASEQTITQTAEYFKKDNPRFDEQKFRDYIKKKRSENMGTRFINNMSKTRV